jgi:GNAT superfamily N-acetyltransferase
MLASHVFDGTGVRKTKYRAMGIIIRPAVLDDVDAIARVHVASWHGAYRGIMPDELIDERTEDVRRTQWSSSLQQPDRTTLVACDENGAVVGFASATVRPRLEGRFQSYLQTLYLLPDAQGRGIGRELLRDLSVRLLEAGVRNMALRTLRLNRARSFYERLGARLVSEGISDDEGQFDDVVYAFDDISVLI